MTDPVDNEIEGRKAFDHWRRSQNWPVTYDWADMSVNEKRAWVRRAEEAPDGPP